MPGVLNSNSNCDFSREVGKMASVMHADIKLEPGTSGLEDLANYILSSSSDFSISGNFTRDLADSDSDLPDNELPMDIINLLDCPDLDVGLKLHRIKCEDGCNSCGETPDRYNKVRVSERQDPFMGLSEQNKRNGKPSTILEQLMSPLDYESEYEQLTQPKVRDTKTFSAWNAPKPEDEPDFMLSKSSSIWQGVFDDDDDDDDEDGDDGDDDDDEYDSSSQELTFPETPSSTQSETVGGDDSDVDIETVTDVPRSSDSSGYSTQSPDLSPSSPGPLQKLRGGSLLTILSASVATNGRISANSSASLTAAAAASRSSLAGSLLSNRPASLLGQKRKLSKDRNGLSKASVQASYQHVLSTSNSINFHDYAMSPGACTYPSPPSSSTETGRPTVLSKRIYKRKQFSMDASEKEKQHHHNQLERNRRQKLADLFMDLRDEVPKIANQAKASKVLILNEATLFIRDLQRQHRQQEDDISKEQRRKEVLRNQLRCLQAQISSSG